MCVTHPVNPFRVPFPRPAPVNPKTFRSRGRPPLRVVHLSDVHIDREYTVRLPTTPFMQRPLIFGEVGAEANCTKSICCRDFADSPPMPTVPAGPNGNSHCDSPVSLADSMLEAIEHLDPEFSIFTGDGGCSPVFSDTVSFTIAFTVVEGAIWLIDQA
jgi:sphingomyelin phosphodiesterase